MYIFGGEFTSPNQVGAAPCSQHASTSVVSNARLHFLSMYVYTPEYYGSTLQTDDNKVISFLLKRSCMCTFANRRGSIITKTCGGWTCKLMSGIN